MAESGTLQPEQPGRHVERVVRDGADPAGARTRVALLGSGELSRELVIALQRLGAEVIAVEGADGDELTATIRRLRPKFVVAAADAIPVDALAATAGAGLAELVPNVRAARLAADMEAMRRLASDRLGLPTAPFWFAGSVDELRSVAEHVGFPMVVKPAVACLGEGQSVMVRAADVEPAWQWAVSAAGDDAERSDAEERRRITAGDVSPRRVLVESVVEVEHEVTLLTVCSDGPAGPVLDFCAPIGHRSVERPNGQLVLESWQPQPMSPAALDAAKSIAARVVRALGGRGVFGIELLVNGDEVYFADLTVAPPDVALLTLRTQRLSAFELQARAILGVPTDTIMISPGAARLVYSVRQPVDTVDMAAPAARPGAGAVLAGALNVAESDVLMFDAADAGRGQRRRRLGAAVTTGSDVSDARERAERVSAALSRLWE